MFIHTRFPYFATHRLITVVLVAVVGLSAAVLRSDLSVSARRASSASGVSRANQEADAAAKDRVKRQYGRLPMNFEVNQGQANDSVRFLSRGHGYQVFLTDNEAALVLQSSVSNESGASNAQPESLTRGGETQSNILRIKPVGAQAGPEGASRITGYDLLPTKSNYLIGNDPGQWHTGIPNYARVEYSEIYPGVNLAFYGTQQALEYDFILAPGADPDSITISVEGAESIELDDNGDLLMRVGGEKVYHRSPLTYQDDRSVAAGRRSVRSRYVLKGGNQIGFAVENYDASKPLVIDPVVD
ncbi:MAG TPA: hypothetical protein VKE91_14645, partial [Blastocatellia bacterium]|nr:hypothetical protein [Blastocatellia bacterium]